MRVLIIEDNKVLSAHLELEFQKRNHTVVIADNGGEALMELGRNPPDVIILDLMLPIVNGWEFLDAKSIDISVASIPVLVLSAFTATLSWLSQAQVVKVVEKPVDAAEIVISAEQLAKTLL